MYAGGSLMLNSIVVMHSCPHSYVIQHSNAVRSISSEGNKPWQIYSLLQLKDYPPDLLEIFSECSCHGFLFYIGFFLCQVVIHKKYGESLSMMIVESGWGSMVPTVVIAHLDNKGPAAKSGQLNVGNQILAVNGQSLVGLPLLEAQNIIRVRYYKGEIL